MPTDEDGEVCHFCKRGRFVQRMEELMFHQWTDKGYVFVRVTASIKICDRCGSRVHPELRVDAPTLWR